MYKLMLVEDEEDVREGILREIDWARHGFEVIETAENGQEAAELFERQVPDVVVTDIRMPFMDGLQLAAWIRQRYEATKIVILTGFDEFEYAQKAVKLHIDEYVLKPYSAQELIDVLAKIKRRIDEEAEEKENVQTLQEHYRRSLPVLREVFLASLVARKLPRREIVEKCRSYDLELAADAYVVSVISMDTGDSEQTDGAAEASLKGSKDTELKRFAVLNIAEEIVEKHRLGRVFLHNDYLVLLTVAGQGTEGEASALKKTLTALEDIRQSIEKYLKFTVTIGVGTVCGELTDVSYSYKDAVLALDYRGILGSNRIICIDDVETRFVEKLRFDELKEHALIRCLKVGTPQEIQETVDGLFHGIGETQVSFKDYQIYLMEMLTAILKAAKDGNVDLDAVLGTDFVPFAELHKFASLQEAKSRILGLCTAIMNSIASQRQYTYKSLVEQAIDYTKSHYHETDISIQKVCSHLHISAGYFSSIFKKEAKMTFVSYLMHIRMEAAKELLRTTDLKAFEIAERVGYAEPNYFSFSFRKHVGVSPKEYRSAAMEGHRG
ncbi:two-component system response regulator [Paenibacillus elgii]|uniref:Two-component system response regulator n=1 Tax=Paenibacillus elgii TaxID=189691 RepID=A0A163ZVB8_9BACL|nr:response regulator [Paenibacillus elgii]KZE82497.1 two-component system response regulator [Paenibacillus elgii]